MRLIIAGGRDIYPSVEFIDDLVKSLFPSFLALDLDAPLREVNQLVDKDGKPYGELGVPQVKGTLVNGMNSRGVDKVAKDWAESRGATVDGYAADWTTHGKAAGPIRNREMAQNADALLLLWDGESKGSASMLKEALKAGIKVVQIAHLSKEKCPMPFIPGQRHTVNFSAFEAPGIGIGNTKAVRKLMLGDVAKDIAKDIDEQFIKELTGLDS